MDRRKSLGGLAALLVLALGAIGIVILGVSLIGGQSGKVDLLPGPNPADKTVLVRMQDRVITRFDFEVAKAYHRLRKGKEGYLLPDHGILLQMLEPAAWEEVLRHHGKAPTQQEIADERARQQRESRDPATLRDIIGLLDRWPGKYEEIMVRSTLTNHGIMRLHQDPTIQKEAHAKAQAGLQEALSNPDYFRKIKADFPEMYRLEDTDHPSSVPGPQGAPMPPGADEPLKQQIRDFAERWLKSTQEGAVLDSVVDGEGAFLVVRLIQRSKERVVYENILFRKSMYDAWFEAELRKLKGEIPDPATREMVKEKLSEHAIGRWLLGQPPKHAQ